MVSILLATKLRIPPQPRQVVHRTRLLDALEHAVPDYKVVLLSAPAGYGKTTLVSQWAHITRFPIVWLSIGEEDNDVKRFFRYLLTGWEKIQPGVKESPLGLLLGGMMPDSQAVLSAFINAANDLTDHVVFVLDDYHLIEEPAIHQALTFLLDHMPPALHFVLTVRAQPPLPLARYRARHELMEFRAEDLQFLQRETAEFLNEMMGLGLADDDVARIQDQLEGWIAGLQLVALTLQRRGAESDDFIVGGKHRFIADYLSEDVLTYLSESVRRFLLQTSILDRLCGQLCDAVTAGEGSQDILEALERDNLFLLSLDNSREWFRYHQIFADFLREELHRRYPDEVADLHRRAARWYLSVDLPEQAFSHAIGGSDADIVTLIINRYYFDKILGGEIALVKRWLGSIQEEWYVSHPELRLAQAASFFFTGQVDASLRCVAELEQGAHAKSADTRWPLAMGAAVRCFIACFHNDLALAELLAHQALQDLPGEDELSVQLRRGIYASLGDTYRRNGRWDEAKESYLRVLEFSNELRSRIGSVHIFGALADLELRQGRLRDAAAYWRKALVVIHEQQTWGTFPLPLIGWVYIRLGEILYEWNQLGDADGYMSRGLERAELGGDVQAIIAGYLLAGHLKLTEGDVSSAGDYLERARPLVQNAPFPDWIGRFGRFQVEMWLAQDRLRAAANWADDMLRTQAPEGQADSPEAQLAIARVLAAKGDALSNGRAATLLDGLLRVAEEEGRFGVHIEALALQALVYWRRGEHTEAMTSLKHALRLAEPEGYVRLFADLGLPMARLLQEARSRDVMPDYTGKLLAAFSNVPTSASTKEPLLEPLSSREQEVLELVAAGLTNKEIAVRLIISAETVKKHLSNICNKLGVRNRTEAVARARELDLLD